MSDSQSDDSWLTALTFPSHYQLKKTYLHTFDDAD